jgi:hypothetical protein
MPFHTGTWRNSWRLRQRDLLKMSRCAVVRSSAFTVTQIVSNSLGGTSFVASFVFLRHVGMWTP